MTWDMWWQMKLMDLQIAAYGWAVLILVAIVYFGGQYLVKRFRKDI